MSVAGWVAAVIVGLVLLLSLATFVMVSWYDIRQWATRRKSELAPAPAPPTLREVYAADMDHWDQRFYAVLDAALPDLCECNPYKFSCPIHARSPEKTYDLRGILRHAERNQERYQRRPELRPQNFATGGLVGNRDSRYVSSPVLYYPKGNR